MYATPEQQPRTCAVHLTRGTAMKIVAINHADSLRRPGARDTVESVLLDTVREGLLSVYGAAEHDIPAEMAAIVRRLDRPDMTRCMLS